MTLKNLSSLGALGALGGSRKSFLFLCLALSLTLGLLVRIPYFFRYDFALNDGALFVQMADAVKSNNYILPTTVSYNRTEIPFAYPPLSFYFIAFLTDLFKFNILDVVRYMPLVFNLLTIGVFILLASHLIKDKIVLLYTSLFFPLIPRSYEWLIMGGGVTRSVGFFFALLAIYQANRVILKYNLKSFIYCTVFMSMALLSHLEWGITTIVTVSLLILYKKFSKQGVVLIIVLVTLVLALTSPWWVTVLIKHGSAPFLAASKTSEWQPLTFASMASITLKLFDDGLGLPLSGLAVIGWLISILKKDWFLPVWLIAIFLTTPRHGPTPAAMPLAILASLGLTKFIVPIFFRVNQNKLSARRAKLYHPLTDPILISSVVAVIFLLIMTNINYTKHTPLTALTRSERSAMMWIKDNTPFEAEFIVLSRSFSWQDDRVAEWFPILSNRKSLTTAQGLEWIPGDVFGSKVKSIEELKHNQALNEKGLAKYLESRYDSFQYVAVFIPQVSPTYGDFRSGYRVAYNNDSVLVFERTAAQSRNSEI